MQNWREGTWSLNNPFGKSPFCGCDCEALRGVFPAATTCRSSPSELCGRGPKSARGLKRPVCSGKFTDPRRSEASQQALSTPAPTGPPVAASLGGRTGHHPQGRPVQSSPAQLRHLSPGAVLWSHGQGHILTLDQDSGSFMLSVHFFYKPFLDYLSSPTNSQRDLLLSFVEYRQFIDHLSVCVSIIA